jgi:hypothetical protein
MNGKQLTATLCKIEAGELYDIFKLLPDIAGGASWHGEIKDTAQRMQEFLDRESEYTLDDLRDLGGDYANGECEDYYATINKRVQELSLWASGEIDAEVQELNQGRDYPSLTDLHAQYLYVAMRQIWDAVADQAYLYTGEDDSE